jgi:hypothetical protein
MLLVLVSDLDSGQPIQILTSVIRTPFPIPNPMSFLILNN